MGAGSAPLPEASDFVISKGVYLVEEESLFRTRAPWTVDGRPVRAWAPHPDDSTLVFLTTEQPELLDFLPVVYEVSG